MAIKLTKNEEKVQKDRLKQYQRYLPTLQMKKQQLQMVIMQTRAELEQKEQHTRVLQPQVQCGIQQKGAHDRRGNQGEEVCHGL